jgi:AbrB family looped-hinge helix DNA binding protein
VKGEKTAEKRTRYPVGEGTMVTVTVSSKYLIVIPKEVRAWMKLKPGQKLRIIEKDGVIQLVPIRDSDVLDFA